MTQDDGTDVGGMGLQGTQKAAALHGVATNRAYDLDERLQAALQALELYEQYV